MSNSALFESEVDGANPSPAANFRPVVKQDHVCPTNRCWGCNSLPGDHCLVAQSGVRRSLTPQDLEQNQAGQPLLQTLKVDGLRDERSQRKQQRTNTENCSGDL